MRKRLALASVLLVAGVGLAGCGADTPVGQVERVEQLTEKAQVAAVASWQQCEALNAAALQQDPADTRTRPGSRLTAALHPPPDVQPIGY